MESRGAVESSTAEGKNPTVQKHRDRHRYRYSCALCPYSTKILGSYKTHFITHSSEKLFKCPKCPFRSKWERSLQNHEKILHGPRSSSQLFQCPETGCTYAAKVKHNLHIHSKLHSKEPRKFSCPHPNCNFASNWSGGLINHVRIHSGEKPWVCQFQSCSFAATTASQLLCHSRTHTKERPFKCLEANCEYSATQLNHLKQHQLTHPPVEGETRPSFKCPVCEYKGKSKTPLSAHIKTHTLEKHFKCEEPNCHFEGRTKAHLVNHKGVHSQEKPWTCPVDSCEYRSKFKSSVTTHLKSHSEEKRYKCEVCPFRAKTREMVKYHLKTVHSDLRPFKCKELNCEYASAFQGNLNKHVKTHKGEKNHSCSFPNCGYRAVLKTNVTRYEQTVHARDLKCGLCDFRTNTMKHLDAHVAQTHTQEKPFSCNEDGCEYRAKRNWGLKRHQKRIHPRASQNSVV